MPREQVADLRAEARTAEGPAAAEFPAREVVCQATEPGRAHRMAFSRCVPAATTTVDSEYPEATEDTGPLGRLMALRTGMKTVIFGMSLPISSRPSISSRGPRHRRR